MIFVRKPLRSLFVVLIICTVIFLLNSGSNEHAGRSILDVEGLFKNNAVWKLERLNLMLERYEVQYPKEKMEELGDNDVVEGNIDHPDDPDIDHPDNNNHADLDENEQDSLDVKEPVPETAQQQWTKLLELMRTYNRLLGDKSGFSRAPNAEVFYISAVVSDTCNMNIRRTITVNGWLGSKHLKEDIFCCVRSQNETSVVKVTKKNIVNIAHIRFLKATQFVCPVQSMYGTDIEVGLVMSYDSCLVANYIDAENEETPPVDNKGNSIALCGKILYGDYFSAERVLEWLELNRNLGVDKIVLYTFNITDDVKAVLQYYVSEGFLVTKEFDFPLKFKYPRYLGMKYMMAYLDEQVVVFDCVARLNKYSYFSILDVDEFIVSRLYTTNDYKSLTKRLAQIYPRAAGFSIRSCVFITDWPKTNPQSDIFVEQYTLRTAAIWDRIKNIIRLDRVKLDTIWTHGFERKLTKYNSVKLPHSVAVLNHYRKCREQWWIDDHQCLTKQEQYNDVAMSRIVEKYRPQISHVQAIVLSKHHYKTSL